MTPQATRRSTFIALAITVALMPMVLGRTQPPALSAGPVDTTAWTTADDHRNMMERLGIKTLRPGPSGREGAPNQANYDEALANPFPKLPEVLTLTNGRRVTTADMWWKQRRPEIVEDFEREVIGRVPKNVPKVTWTVAATTETNVGSYPVIGRQLVGHVEPVNETNRGTGKSGETI